MSNLTSIEVIQDTQPRRIGPGMAATQLRVASTSAELSISEEEILQVADAVCRSTCLDPMVLPDEFFPGHLSVALIDAMSSARRKKQSASASNTLDSMRYCRRFGIARTRVDRWETPPVADQETLGDLLQRYDADGLDRMEGDGFGLTGSGCDGSREAVKLVLDAARALREVRIEVLQDIQTRHPDEIETALRGVSGADEESVRLLLMFSGDDHFVRGDGAIRMFVASALGRRSVPAIHAEELVRRAAYELILSPRLLDYVLWTYSMRGGGLPKPPEPARLTRGIETHISPAFGISLTDASVTPSPHD